MAWGLSWAGGEDRRAGFDDSSPVFTAAARAADRTACTLRTDERLSGRSRSSRPASKASRSDGFRRRASTSPSTGLIVRSIVRRCSRTVVGLQILQDGRPGQPAVQQGPDRLPRRSVVDLADLGHQLGERLVRLARGAPHVPAHVDRPAGDGVLAGVDTEPPRGSCAPTLDHPLRSPHGQDPTGYVLNMSTPISEIPSELEPEVGLEPTTCALRVRCSTD